MEQRLDMVLAPEQYGVTVAEVCQLWGVSRQTFYVWRRRYEDEGLAGLEDRSSRPARSPARMPADLEARIVDMRQAHRRWGPRRIRSELERLGAAAPARSTIGRVLTRNGLVAPPPPAAPPPRRFVRQRANELWQLDAKQTVLSDGTAVQVISCLDDHSRYCGACTAFAELSSEAAIAVFDAAVAELGAPEATLADRGAIFTGRRTGSVNAFERHVWACGTITVNGRGYHPQTQGKVERFHRTLIEWLEDHGPFPTLSALNRSLRRFRHHYNHERPHQAIGGATPAEVWAAAPKAGPSPELAAEHCRRESLHTTSPKGSVTCGDWVIGLGLPWARTKVRIVDRGTTIEVRGPDGGLIREATPEHGRRYLGTGKRGGHRRRPEQLP